MLVTNMPQLLTFETLHPVCAIQLSVVSTQLCRTIRILRVAVDETTSPPLSLTLLSLSGLEALETLHLQVEGTTTENALDSYAPYTTPRQGFAALENLHLNIWPSNNPQSNYSLASVSEYRFPKLRSLILSHDVSDQSIVCFRRLLCRNQPLDTLELDIHSGDEITVVLALPIMVRRLIINIPPLPTSVQRLSEVAQSVLLCFFCGEAMLAFLDALLDVENHILREVEIDLEDYLFTWER